MRCYQSDHKMCPQGRFQSCFRTLDAAVKETLGMSCLFGPFLRNDLCYCMQPELLSWSVR